MSACVCVCVEFPCYKDEALRLPAPSARQKNNTQVYEELFALLGRHLLPLRQAKPPTEAHGRGLPWRDRLHAW